MKGSKPIRPTPENPHLFYCLTEKRFRFNDQRETCFEEGHAFEPAIGKRFTEMDEYFEGVEFDALERGEIVL